MEPADATKKERKRDKLKNSLKSAKSSSSKSSSKKKHHKHHSSSSNRGSNSSKSKDEASGADSENSTVGRLSDISADIRKREMAKGMAKKLAKSLSLSQKGKDDGDESSNTRPNLGDIIVGDTTGVSAMTMGDFQDETASVSNGNSNTNRRLLLTKHNSDRSVGSLRSIASAGSNAGSVHSVRSAGSGSARSIFSSSILQASQRGMERAATANSVEESQNRILEASQRGMERAESSNLTVEDWKLRRSSTSSSKSKKKRKEKKEGKYSSQIRGIVEASARQMHVEVGSDATNTGNIDRLEMLLKKNEESIEADGEEEENPILLLPTTTSLLKPRHFKLSKKMDMHDDDSSAGSASLATHEKKDKRYLRETSKSKFEKGLACFQRKKYALSRSKFRASLKTHLLLYGDMHYLSISPVHEMIGRVEGELGQFEKSELHLLAALEICEKALEKLEAEEEENGGGVDEIIKEDEKEGGKKEKENPGVIFEGMDQLELVGSPRKKAKALTKDDERQILLVNIGRINKTIEVVKADAVMKKPQVPTDEENKNDIPSKDDALKGRPKGSKIRGGKSEAILRMEALQKQRNAQMGVREKEEEEAKDQFVDTIGGLNSIREVSDSKQVGFEDDDIMLPPSLVQTTDRPKRRLGIKRMSTRSSDRVRHRYRAQSELGEEHYENGEYDLAIPCFNDAKFALLIIAGMPENKAISDSWNENPEGQMYAKLRDEVNSALLSERITDCHVQTLSTKTVGEEDEDFATFNYRQAATMVSETKKLIRETIKEKTSAAKAKEEARDYLDDYNVLLNEANIALARLLSKQGSVYAKVDNHTRALDLFSESFAAWEEAANIAELSGRSVELEDNDDPLIRETSGLMSSYHESHPPKHSYDAKSLKNTTHLKALSSALQLASSHHALGAELSKGTSEDSEPFEEAIVHYLQALEFIRVAQCLRAASDVLSMGGNNRAGRRLTVVPRQLTVLMASVGPKDMVENVEEFMKRCDLLNVQQQLGISQAALRLGHRTLSKKWFLKALDSMNSLDSFHAPKAQKEAQIATYIFSVLMGETTEFDEEKLDGYDNEPRLLIQFGMSALQNGQQRDAMEIFKQATALCNSSDPPDYQDEVLRAMDAQIIIKLEEGNMDGAVQAMRSRMNLVSDWIGSSSSALAKDMHRLACVHSMYGCHEDSAKLLGESIFIGSDYDDYDVLDSVKLLATSLDVMNDLDGSKSEYELALTKEKDNTEKTRIMNALANLHVKVEGQTQLAVEYLDKSLEIQHNIADGEGTDANLKFDTMILYGNAMASKNDVTQAAYWFESALNSNPDKSPVHPSNLRALYNKGVTLFRSGDIIGAGHAFGSILDEVEMSSAVPPGTGFVLNAIGSIYFVNKDYVGACEQFTKSLSLKNDELTPSQMAMTYANIGTAYYKMRKYEESEANFNQALKCLESEDDRSLDIKVTTATVKSKFACILYKQKLYLRAYDMFAEAASSGSETASEFVTHCGSLAEKSRRNLMKRDPSVKPPPSIAKISSHKPHFGEILIPITDRRIATRYSDAVYSKKRKILAALGMELADCTSIELPSEDTKILCERALENLLEVNRANSASEFEGLAVEKLNSHLMTMKSLLSQNE